jgi:hypothetical protein
VSGEKKEVANKNKTFIYFTFLAELDRALFHHGAKRRGGEEKQDCVEVQRGYSRLANISKSR